MRTFCPNPVSKLIECIGGVSALLGLVAMATDVEGLYASVKALSCVLRSNPSARRDMERTRGYQVHNINNMNQNSTRTPFLPFSLETVWQSHDKYMLFAGWEIYMCTVKNVDQWS